MRDALELSDWRAGVERATPEPEVILYRGMPVGRFVDPAQVEASLIATALARELTTAAREVICGGPWPAHWRDAFATADQLERDGLVLTIPSYLKPLPRACLTDLGREVWTILQDQHHHSGGAASAT